MGAQESTEEAPEGALEEGQSPGAANESKEELTTPTRFRRRSRSEPPDPRAAEALSPAAIDLRLDEARSPANVDPRLRPPARVRASSTLALFPEEAYAESVSAVLCSKFVVVQVILNVVASIVGPIVMFALLFAVLKQGPHDSDGPELVGVGWGSLIMSPLSIFMMMPVAMPEAVEAGWFKPIRLETCGRWRFFLPLLGTHGALALGPRKAFVSGRAGGYRVLSLFTVDCSLCHGPDAQHKDADLVLGVLHGRVGAAGHRVGVPGLRRRAQPRADDRHDAPPQKSLHPNAEARRAGGRHVPLPVLRRARALAEAARTHATVPAPARRHSYPVAGAAKRCRLPVSTPGRGGRRRIKHAQPPPLPDQRGVRLGDAHVHRFTDEVPPRRPRRRRACCRASFRHLRRHACSATPP